MSRPVFNWRSTRNGGKLVLEDKEADRKKKPKPSADLWWIEPLERPERRELFQQRSAQWPKTEAVSHTDHKRSFSKMLVALWLWPIFQWILRSGLLLCGKAGFITLKKEEMSPLLDKNHIIIFKLLKILSFLYQLNLAVLFESKSTPYQVYLAALVCPTQLCLLKLQHPWNTEYTLSFQVT